jgi:class 3 adenylate cyclase/tetratricopeptide (TPR) repeat protein
VTRTCGSCGHDAPEAARFCASCGASLGPALAGRKERKLATALFADVAGSTALAEREDPEVVEAILGRAFERAEREIERHGGLLEKFIGDAILAVFGVPFAHEDDPERAVRAALAVQGEITALGRELAAEGRAPLALRIGIETGEILVDVERAAGARHRMLTGDAVNTAARLEQAAGAGQVVVGPEAHAATAELFAYEALPARDLRGKTAPVAAWRAIRARPAARGVRTPLRLQARLVGRAEELAVLERTLAAVRSAGRPRLVTVVGPAGIGKSRLAHELLERVERAPEPVSIRRGRCVAYGNVSYSALAEAMKAECAVLDDDPPAMVEERARAMLSRLFGDSDLLPHLAALVGAGGEQRFGREDLFDAWRRILERMATAAPLVLVVEDLHWADDGLLDFLEHVVAWAKAPILLLALARPDLLERRATWGAGGGRGRRQGVVMRLGPLSGEEADRLVHDLLAAQLPPALSRLVLEAGAGNPLYCEEITRMLVDRGVVRIGEAGRLELGAPLETLAVPRTIQGLLAARLDVLTGEQKAVLQDAAVVGRTFWLGALEELQADEPARIPVVLADLESRGLIRRHGVSRLSGEAEYAFHHVLVRDVAYESLPKALRAARHVATARWAEAQAGDRRDEIAELLATHHLQALHWLDDLGETNGERPAIERDAFRWARTAGERARRLWQQREAVRWLRSALDLGSRLGRDDAELAPLWESYAIASDGIAPVPDVVGAWTEALVRYERTGSAAGVGRVEASIASVLTWEEGAPETRRLAERAIDRLEPLGESADLGFALYVLGRHHLERGDLDRAEPLLRRAVSIAAHVEDRPVQARAAISLGWTLHARRRGAETVQLFDEALAIARSAGDLALLLDALEAVLSAAVEVSGDYVRAEVLNREAIDVAGRAGNLVKLARAQLNLGYLLREIGRLDEVKEPLLAAREAAEASGDVRDAAWARAVEAITAGVRGDAAVAREGIGEFTALLRQVDVTSVPYVEEITGIVGGYIAMAEGRDAEGAKMLVAAHLRVRDERLSVWFGQVLLFECVAASVRAGRPDEARLARDRLAFLAAANVPPRAFLAWADGLLAPDPAHARDLLVDAAARLETLGRRVDLGRCLVDLAAVDKRLGNDGAALAARGSGILRSCGAALFVPDGGPPLSEPAVADSRAARRPPPPMPMPTEEAGPR